MTKTINPFELPDEMRKALDQGVSQARLGFEKIMDAADQAVETLENKAGASQYGLTEMQRKSLAMTETNVAAAFDLTQKMINAKSLDEVFKLQSEYLTQQFEVVKGQMQEAGEVLQRRTRSTIEEMTKEGTKIQTQAKEAMEKGAESLAKATRPKK